MHKVHLVEGDDSFELMAPAPLSIVCFRYNPGNLDDPSIIRQSNQQRRMILTRDIELLKNGKARYGYWIRSTNADEQIREVFNRFSLADNIHPFSLCMKCNGKLCRVPLDHVRDKVPPKVKKWHSEFWECDSCEQVYWQGSHFEKLKKKVEELKKISC